MTIHEILAALSKRKRCGGISTAHGYLRSLAGCFDGGACPVQLLGGSGPADWAAALEKSKGSLVYHAPGMDVTDADFDMVSEAAFAEMLKAPGLANDMPLKAAGVFEHVTTTTRRDRDRDILETGGAIVDPKGPLLLQHMPFDLLGKLIRVVKHTKSRLIERSAIVDNALGRDTMLLVEFGAFRISHGFLPDFSDPENVVPLDEKNPWDGFRIRKFEVLERSLVSIPSNVDAEILGYESADQKAFDAFATLFSRGKLATDFYKGWAGGVHRSRPKSAPGWGAGTKGQQSDAPNYRESINESKTCAKCRFFANARCGKYDFAGQPGNVCDSFAGGMASHDANGHKDGCGCGGTCGKCKTAAADGSKRYELCQPGEANAQLLAGGGVLLPIKVFDPAVIINAAPAELDFAKAGRVLSKKNQGLLEDAAGAIADVLKMDDVPRAAKALLREAASNLKTVLEAVTADDSEDDAGDDTASKRSVDAGSVIQALGGIAVALKDFDESCLVAIHKNLSAGLSLVEAEQDKRLALSLGG